ncbi:MAG: hypothetical protein ACRDDX_07620 [Cellulosilyticaceae bacterium]
MLERLEFDADSYDLDGLLGKCEMAMADLVFMVYEEETESYYMDRMACRKYDSAFNRLMMRIRDYLEQDENNGLFILFASLKEGKATLYDGSGLRDQEVALGDIDPEEDCFYGMMIQQEAEKYVFHEAVYMNANYEGNARAALIQHAGDLSDALYHYVTDFE